MGIKEQITSDFANVLQKLKLPAGKGSFQHPSLAEHGDFATSIALSLFKKRADSREKEVAEAKNPVDLANIIVNAWRSGGLPDYIAHLEVVAPGFINVHLSKEYLVGGLVKVLEDKDKYGSSDFLKGKKILLEHTSPNPQTTIMFGHLRNNFIGMTLARLLEFEGAKVIKDEIINDRGVHLCRSMFGYLFFMNKKTGFSREELENFRDIADERLLEMLAGQKTWQEQLSFWTAKKSDWYTPKELGLKSDHANLVWYVLGSRAYKINLEAKKQVEQILVSWEAGDKNVRALWSLILGWSDEGYGQTYARIGSKHDWVWRESDHYQKGKDIVELGLKKGIFKKSQGAIVTDLGKFGLPDTVVVKSDGTALYITQDLALVRLKKEKFPSDLYIWVVGSEQKLYFQQLFAVSQQLGINSKEKMLHLAYGLVNFKGAGKMSTRTGNVVMADEVLDVLEERAEKIIKESNQKLRGKISEKQLKELAQHTALAALKYSLLRYDIFTTINFDIDESLSLKGNSGPYLQYTYARCRSVLDKADKENFQFPVSSFQSNSKFQFTNEETALLRGIYKFSEVIKDATISYSPGVIANYIYDLASLYNLFYDKHSILQAPDPEQREFRLALTAAVAQIIKNSLTLFGIEPVEKM